MQRSIPAMSFALTHFFLRAKSSMRITNPTYPKICGNITSILEAGSNLRIFMHAHVFKESCIIKGALDNFSLIPRFFSKKLRLPLEVYTYVVTAYLILLATST